MEEIIEEPEAEGGPDSPGSRARVSEWLLRALREVAETVIPAVVIALIINLFLAQATQVLGQSMEPNLHSTQRVVVVYEFPLNEVIVDFYNQLKSITRGYASFDYEFLEFRTSPLVKLDILINGEVVDALSLIVPQERAYLQGRSLCSKMRKIIPRQLFEVVIQAAVGNRIISRETVKALRKNVTAKCYGGDITRKRKLLEKQKEGKKKMKRIGRVDIPQSAFLALLEFDEQT